MIAKEQGFYWHVHHDVLVEYCYDYDERRRYIANQKPEAERELRLRLFQKVRGNLPKAYVEVWKAYDETCKVYNEACKVYYEACKVREEAYQAHNEAWKAREEAYQAHNEALKVREEAWNVCDEAWKAYKEACKACVSEIETLHALECPDCPWDGKTIFPVAAAEAAEEDK